MTILYCIVLCCIVLGLKIPWEMGLRIRKSATTGTMCKYRIGQAPSMMYLKSLYLCTCFGTAECIKLYPLLESHNLIKKNEKISLLDHGFNRVGLRLVHRLCTF